jgi:hypothetical protein
MIGPRFYILLLLVIPFQLVGQNGVRQEINDNTINGWTEVNISIDSFIQADSFIIVGHSNIEIVSFWLIIDPKAGKPGVVIVNGNRVKGVGTEWIMALKAGDTVIIDHIRGKSDSGPIALTPAVYRTN